MEVNSALDFIPLMIQATILTVIVSFISIFFAIVIGVFTSLIMYYKIPVLKQISYIYVEFFRNTPTLVQVYFLFYGLPKLIPYSWPTLDAQTAQMLCSIAVLSLLGGAYMCESMKGGMKSIPKSLSENALALGLSKKDTIIHLILPQTISYSFSAITTNSIFIIKEVSVMKIIALTEIVYQTFILIGQYPQYTLQLLGMMVICYLVILFPISIFCSIIERRVRHAEFGT